MRVTFLLFSALLLHITSSYAQVSKQDTMNRYGLHLGMNFGALIAGGAEQGGGALKIGPRIGVHLNEKMAFGLEYNTDYQTIFAKDSLALPNIRLSRWVGPFFRYYMFAPEKKWNMVATANYVYGSYYSWTEVEQLRQTYHTAILGLGASYKTKHFLIEGGYRYTFLINNTPIEARWTNTLFLGVTKNF
jgi:hypothetical protein